MNLNGKRVLITGASDGIGKQAALDLARMGADIVIAGRNESKTRAVLDQVKALGGAGDCAMLLADLSSIQQTKDLAARFLECYDRLDVLLNNAGAAFQDYATSADGIEMTLALNHISYYLLGNLLLDAMKRAADAHGEARMINVSSSAHQQARDGLNLEDPPMPRVIAASASMAKASWRTCFSLTICRVALKQRRDR